MFLSIQVFNIQYFYIYKAKLQKSLVKTYFFCFIIVLTQTIDGSCTADVYASSFMVY